MRFIAPQSISRPSSAFTGCATLRAVTDDPAPATALRYGWRYFRRHGAAAAARAFFARYVYRSSEQVIFRSGLAGPPAPDHLGEIRFRLATAADRPDIEALSRHGRPVTIMEDGDWLFVAEHGDRIIATRVYNCAIPPHGLLSRVIDLKPGQVYMADLFIAPAYRNQSVGRHLALYADRFLAGRGYTEMFTAVATTNTPSIRLSLHKGSRPHCYVAYFRLLFHERLVVTADMPHRLDLR
jgi:GNAT superfamily N-acetyltransferase